MSFGRAAQEIHPDSYVYLFGSQAKGTSRKGSDIDVAVIIDRVEGCESEPTLAREASHRLNILGAVEFSPVEGHLIQADFDESGFLGNILETGIQLLTPVDISSS